MVFLSRGYLKYLVACVLLFALSGRVEAQLVFGSIIGTVTDPAGAAVNNAKVTITDVTKNTSSEVMTNESGQYTKGQLIPDTYKVTIEAPGFSKVASNELVVQVDQATQFNAAMTVGNVNQTVEVTAAAPLLQTDRADVAQTFTAKEISQLPSIGRNLQAFELLNPGTAQQPWQHASDEDPQGSIQTVVNGQLFDSTGYYLDGTINQDPILGIIVINPTFDSVNEVKQANQDYDAEFGYTGGGILTYSTKSGTNQFHGDAFDYIQVNTPGFQDFARNPFSENTAAGVPTTHENQFGGSISGKIIKDKLFFFGDAQLTRRLEGGSLLTTVPSLLNRTGNFSDWLAVNPNNIIYDPTTGNPTTGVGRTPYLNNTIPAAQLSKQALNLLQYFPLPNVAGSVVNGVVAPYNNYENSGTLNVDGNQWNTRFDYVANEKNTFFGRYSYATFTEQAPGVFGTIAGGQAFNNANYAGNSSAFNESIAGGWTHTVNPTLINELRFGYMRYHVTDVPNGYGTQPATAAGIPGENLDNTYTSGLPYFEIDNPGAAAGTAGSTTTSIGYALGNNTHCNCPLDELERQYQFVDNISKNAGNHNFKFGADVRYALNLRVPSDNHRAGQNYFNGSYTGDVAAGATSPTGGIGLATFLLGDVTTFNRYVSSSTNAQERQKRLFWYGQDEWHVNSKLTFTYGLRWEMVFPETVNEQGNGAELNVNTGNMEVFGIGLVSNHGYQNMNWHNFAPRVGLAYQLTPKTVIRAGYGWTYSLGTFGNNFGHNVTQNPPVLLNQTLQQNQPNASGGCPTTFCDVFNLAQGPQAPNLAPYQPNAYGVYKWPGSGVAAFTRPGTLTLPTVYVYNFTVQRQVTTKISVSGGYVGNSGRHSILGTDENFNINQPYFVPGVSSSSPSLFPFAGLYGPRYNYGWTAAVNDFCNCANNQYNSFQGIFTIRDLAGLSMNGNYTYQVAQGDGNTGNGGNGAFDAYAFLYDRALGYGNSPFLPHQQFVFAPTYSIPFGRGRKFGGNTNRLVDAVLGGWNISSITTFYSGFPFQPSIENYGSDGNGGTISGPYNGPNNRPNVGTGSPYSSVQNRNQWIVGIGSSAYTLPAVNTFGNYPINSLYGPIFINEDASLMKVFSLTERLKFTLRVDTTNTFNHTNLGLPNPDIQSGSVGQITSTAQGGNYNMRRIQYSGSINF